MAAQTGTRKNFNSSWNLQNDYDVQIAKRDLGKILDRIETVNKPKAA